MRTPSPPPAEDFLAAEAEAMKVRTTTLPHIFCGILFIAEQAGFEDLCSVLVIVMLAVPAVEFSGSCKVRGAPLLILFFWNGDEVRF